MFSLLFIIALKEESCGGKQENLLWDEWNTREEIRSKMEKEKRGWKWKITMMGVKRGKVLNFSF